jgi:hypothetical protein
MVQMKCFDNNELPEGCTQTSTPATLPSAKSLLPNDAPSQRAASYLKYDKHPNRPSELWFEIPDWARDEERQRNPAVPFKIIIKRLL